MAHNSLAGLILHLGEVIGRIVGGVVMDKPVIKTSNDILEGLGNPTPVYAIHIILEPQQGGALQVHAHILNT